MKDQEEKDYSIWIIGALSVLLIVGLWLYTYYRLKGMGTEDRGTFGDMFGSVNAIYSGLALAGIIITILLQGKELKLQRKELKETREEFKIQNLTLRFQRFENTFFNLLSLHHQIVEAIDLDIYIENKEEGSLLQKYPPDMKLVTINGRDVFKRKYEELKNKINENPQHELNFNYLKIYETVQTDFGHYFRNLYRIIKFVNETEFHSYSELDLDPNNAYDVESYNGENFNTRYQYTSMIRAQLSDYELLWIFYNCLSENGFDKFKPLVEAFSLLKNMPWDKLHDESLTERYNQQAFSNF